MENTSITGQAKGPIKVSRKLEILGAFDAREQFERDARNCQQSPIKCATAQATRDALLAFGVDVLSDSEEVINLAVVYRDAFRNAYMELALREA